MMLHRVAFVFVLVSLAFSTSATGATTTSCWMVRPGTISDAMAKPDGSLVYLDAVVVDKIRARQSPGYMVVYEPFSPKDRLIVLTQPAPELRLGQTVDVEGTITTLGSGYRAIINPTIHGYLDKEGRLMLRGGTIKGFIAPRPWPWKTDLTVESASIESTADASSVEPDPAPDDAATYCPTISDIFEASAFPETASIQSQGIRVQAYYEDIGELDGLADGALVELDSKRITAADTETINDITYKYVDIADDPPDTGAIRTYYTGTVSVNDRIRLITGQIRYVNQVAVICVDTGPGYVSTTRVGKIVTVSLGSIAYALTLPDAESAMLDDKVVTANQTDFPSALYVQEPSSSGQFGGIRVWYSVIPPECARGDLVDVSGYMAKGTDGEREIINATVTPAGQGTVPEPLGMINRDLGGGAFGMYTPGISDPAGSGAGLYNKGSLVRVWGTVTEVDDGNKFFYLHDGSVRGSVDGTKVPVRVSWAWSPSGKADLVMPALDTFMSVIGISGSDTADSVTYYRVLRPRNQADVYWPTDTTAPDPGDASSPAFVNSSPIAVTYSGASDEMSGIKKVEFWYKQGHAGMWTYSGCNSAAESGSFDFPVSEDGTYYFDLVAEDNAGNRSATPTDDGDCHTICEADLSASGRSFVHFEYLYPGGPLVRTSAYDESGNQVREVTRSYGSEGELLGISGSTEPVTYTYDGSYRIKAITDAMNRTTNYVYDDDGDPNTQDPKVGYLSRVEYPGGEVIRYSDHDAYGRPRTRTDAKSIVTEYHYDDMEGLLTQVEYPATPSLNVNYEYDPAYGRLTQVTDGTGVTTYAYDDLGIPTSVITTYSGLPARTIEFDYYQSGDLKAMTTPAGSFSYTYDAAGRPTGLTNPFAEVFSWDYYDNSALETQTTPVSSTSCAYDPRSFLTTLTNRKTDETLLSEYSGPSTGSRMTYDAVGNLLSMTATVPNVASQYSGTTDYLYPGISYEGDQGRLLREQSARNGGYDYAFAYDTAGNPTVFEGATRAYNSKNQSTAAGFVYDANGNPTTYNGQAAIFDAEDRMTSFGTALTAGYTGGGLRAWKESASGRTYFLYSGNAPVCELDSAGNVVAVNTFGATGILARREDMQAQAASKFYTFDPLGNVSQTLDEAGDVSSTQLYDAYGTPLYGTPAFPYGYGGQSGYYTDSETGLLLLTHRYYDPEEGRFLTRDPIGYAGGMNLYGYVGNNPVNAADPLGFCPYGTGYGASARDYYAEQSLEHPWNPLNYVGGVLSSMWTPETYKKTAVVIGCGLTAGVGIELLAARGAAAGLVPEIIQGSGGAYQVYGLVDDAGVVQRVGQTVNEAARRAFWSRNLSDLEFRTLAGNLTKVEADGVEQLLIQGYGGASWNGGTLINKINVISPSRPYYSSAAEAAYGILFK